MSSIYRADVPGAIDKGRYCESAGGEVFFCAPIDLLPNDSVMIDSASGQPLAIYRESRKIWEFQGMYVTGTMTMRWEGMGGAELARALGVIE